MVRSRFVLFISCIFILALNLAGCGGTAADSSNTTEKTTAAEASTGISTTGETQNLSTLSDAQATSTVSEGESTAVVGEAASTVETGETMDINKNDTGKTVIKAISKNSNYPNNSYMIISAGGTVAVLDPTQSVGGIKPDLITSTHNHPDHFDYSMDSNTDCKKSYYIPGESFTVKDIKVTSIASSHSRFAIDEAKPSNVIYVYEVDGLRIAHMGDIGQEQLTDEQLKALGKIDIAFMQFVNSYSDYSLENGKGFTLIEQLKPQIIIPTHSSAEATEKIVSIAGAGETVDNVLAVGKDDLKDGKRKVIDIKNTLAK